MYVSWMLVLTEHVKASAYQTGDVADCPEFEVCEVKSRISLQNVFTMHPGESYSRPDLLCI